MSDSDAFEFVDTGFAKLLKAVKLGDTQSVKIGVLGGKDARKDGSNATVGARHEFGLDGMPVRSFLRMPITEKLQSYLESAGAFTPEAAKDVMARGSFGAWLAKVGAVGVTVVLDAFSSGGFGKWKPSNMAHKQNKQTLVETTQLRNSITFEVSE